ncbi:MAG: glycoside hydrolase family 32 protein [Anaerolineae bacterium]|nr:glycoside hydrolase family 32 protein [Anaerolineae bacterium]
MILKRFGLSVVDPFDPHRPQYHFLPPANWMNDPNGPIFWQGCYHLFYQHNPEGPRWGPMHWGHAASPDLVQWEHLPIALAPTPGSPDEGGCWSGCAVHDGGVPTLIYTGVSGERFQVQRTCLATSADGLLTFHKHPANPVTEPPPGMDLVGFRDPCVWREGDAWYQAIGSGIRGFGGAVLLYRSPDLVHWDYLHPLCARNSREADPLPTGEMWECPQFFPLGGRHVLLVSAIVEGRPGYVACFVGRYEKQQFIPEALRRLDHGPDYYAPITQLDPAGRRILWGWSWEGRSPAAQEAAGWAGVMALPRILSLRPDGDLGIAPAPELAALRGRHRQLGGGAVDDAEEFDVSGERLEILAEFEPQAREVGLRLRRSPGGEEETLVYYDPKSSRLVVDRERASLDPAAYAGVHGGPLALGRDEPLRLHLFLDHSILEVYANERVSLTERIYPSRADSLGVAAYAPGGRASLLWLEAWELGAIWEGTL